VLHHHPRLPSVIAALAGRLMTVSLDADHDVPQHGLIPMGPYILTGEIHPAEIGLAGEVSLNVLLANGKLSQFTLSADQIEALAFTGTCFRTGMTFELIGVTVPNYAPENAPDGK
jgi:hypothetical protein